MWCWWCCHPFDGAALQMPYRHDDRRNIFTTTGNFCSWSCMKSYALDKYGLSRGGIICGNIVMMRRRMYRQSGHVKPAPCRFKLGVFGGDMTIDEFRENQTVDKVEVVEELLTVPYKDHVIPFISSTRKMEEIKAANTADNNALKLKRSKPLKRNHNNLENALGLIIKPK